MAKTDFSLTGFKVTTVSATTAYHDLSQYITEESHAMGDAWVEHLYTGMRRVTPITIGGFYDDVGASGPHAIFGQATDIGAERNVKLNLGTTNAYPKFDVIVKRYTRKPVRGVLTKFEVELLPTGAVTVVAT
jgi:hypothetical protein